HVEQENEYSDTGNETLSYESGSSFNTSSQHFVPSGIRPAFATPHRSKYSLVSSDTTLWSDRREGLQSMESSQEMQGYYHGRNPNELDDDFLQEHDDTIDSLAGAFGQVNLDRDEGTVELGMPSETESTDYSCNASTQSEQLRQVQIVDKCKLQIQEGGF